MLKRYVRPTTCPCQVPSHRHCSVHEQHVHEARGRPTLASCSHEFGPSLALHYLASMALAAMVVCTSFGALRSRSMCRIYS
eukprot:2967555-Prymnesium_polylepis.1